MSRLCSGAFAITSSGKVILNAGAMDGANSVEEAYRTARRLGLVVFIGIQLTEKEVASAMARLGHGFEEAAAYAAGYRQTRLREPEQR